MNASELESERGIIIICHVAEDYKVLKAEIEHHLASMGHGRYVVVNERTTLVKPDHMVIDEIEEEITSARLEERREQVEKWLGQPKTFVLHAHPKLEEPYIDRPQKRRFNRNNFKRR